MIWLSASGLSAVCASAKVFACHGPLSAVESASMRRLRCYDGPRPYPKTYGWELGDVTVLPDHVQIVRKRGSVIWQTGP